MEKESTHYSSPSTDKRNLFTIPFLSQKKRNVFEIPLTFFGINFYPLLVSTSSK